MSDLSGSQNDWIEYVPLPIPEGRRTVIESVRSKSSGHELGQIRWWPCWRKHAFAPAPNTIFEPSCLTAITARCRELTAEHKGLKARDSR